MDSEILFRTITVVLLLTAFAMSGTFRRRADRRGGSLSPEGGRLLIGLRILGLFFVLPILLYILAPQTVSWARLDLPVWLHWIGAAIASAMVPVLYWVLSTIGSNISPTQGIREDHELVRNGPYARVRHPLYTAAFLFYLGLVLMTGLWWLALGLVLGSAAIVIRTKREEENLTAAFGDEYRLYMQETGRFFPRRLSTR